MSACSSWDEVLDAINTAGADLLGVERMRLPTMYDGDRGDRLDPQEEREPISMRSALNAITIAITTVAASAIAAISVKIA